MKTEFARMREAFRSYCDASNVEKSPVALAMTVPENYQTTEEAVVAILGFIKDRIAVGIVPKDQTAWASLVAIGLQEQHAIEIRKGFKARAIALACITCANSIETVDPSEFRELLERLAFADHVMTAKAGGARVSARMR